MPTWFIEQHSSNLTIQRHRPWPSICTALQQYNTKSKKTNSNTVELWQLIVQLKDVSWYTKCFLATAKGSDGSLKFLMKIHTGHWKCLNLDSLSSVFNHTNVSWKTVAKEINKILATELNIDPQSILLGISSRRSIDNIKRSYIWWHSVHGTVFF